jgi:soluble lytic murein transglycosylase-like protein
MRCFVNNNKKGIQPAKNMRSTLLIWKHVAVWLALLLAGVAGPAHADVWGYVDEKGAAHFASEKLDDRYELFFRGNQGFDAAQGVKPQAVERVMPSSAYPPNARGAASAPPRLAAYFEVSTGYKAVRHLLRESAKKNNLDYELLQALISTESGFDTQVVSPKGAVGLMQLIPPTAARYGVRPDANRTVEQKLTDPKVNIAAGSQYLRDLIKLFPGRLDLALAAYNAGEGAVQRHGNKIPPYKETQNYVATVMQLYNHLKPPNLLATALPASAANRVRVELPAPKSAIPGRGNMVPGMSPSPVPSGSAIGGLSRQAAAERAK